MYMVSDKTAVVEGDSFSVTIGLNLEHEIELSALWFTLDYDATILKLIPNEIQFPGKLTSASTGPFYFTLAPKGVDAQPSGDVIILPFEVLAGSKEAIIKLEVNRARTPDDISINLPAPAPLGINKITTLHGDILYQPSPTPATVTLQGSTGSPITTTTAKDGSYALSIPTPQEGARYTLVVTKPGYLSYTVKNLDLANWEDEKTIDIRQLAGDVNGDGIVNAVDLTCLLSEFNQAPLKFAAADIDGNSIVNAADLTYLLAGFNKRDVVVDRG
jgi:hypothetical protein